MSESVTHRWDHTQDSELISNSKAYTSGGMIRVTETIAIGASDLSLPNVKLDVSAVKAFEIIADQALLIEPNSATIPDAPMTLVANVPYRWNTDSYDAFFFTVDWTGLFVTNSSGVAATLKIRGVYDVTP